MGSWVPIKHGSAGANSHFRKSLSWYLAGSQMDTAGKELLCKYPICYSCYRLDYINLWLAQYGSARLWYIFPPAPAALGSIRSDFLSAWYEWHNTSPSEWGGCFWRVFCDEVGSAQRAGTAVLMARVPAFLFGFTSGGDDGRYYKATCSSFNTYHLS